MILFVGQVGRSMTDREAFQEVDFRRMFGEMVKWVAQIDDPARIPEYVSHAFHTAMAGRRGPVVLALPEDMLRERAAAIDTRAYKTASANPSDAQIAELKVLLERAERPLAVVGGSGWNAQAREDLRRFAETNSLPVAASFRCQDRLDNDSPSYVGFLGPGASPALNDRVKNADLLLVVGARMGEMTTRGYSLMDIPVPRQTLVHVYPGPEEIGRVYQADLPICSGSPEFLSRAAAMAPVDPTAWADETRKARAEFKTFMVPPVSQGAVNLGSVVAHLRERLPRDAIITNGAGNYAVWAHRFLMYRDAGTQLGPTSGAMGYGLPAAVAAKKVHPERAVVCFAGDGCFLMNGQEIATAVQYGLNIIVLVINNGMFGTIRMHQERNYPGRTVASRLINPDFAAFARAFGAHGETVERTEEFAPALERALAAELPALIEIRVDPEDITPGGTIQALRAGASRAKTA